MSYLVRLAQRAAGPVAARTLSPVMPPTFAPGADRADDGRRGFTEIDTTPTAAAPEPRAESLRHQNSPVRPGQPEQQPGVGIAEPAHSEPAAGVVPEPPVTFDLRPTRDDPPVLLSPTVAPPEPLNQPTIAAARPGVATADVPATATERPQSWSPRDADEPERLAMPPTMPASPVVQPDALASADEAIPTAERNELPSLQPSDEPVFVPAAALRPAADDYREPAIFSTRERSARPAIPTAESTTSPAPIDVHIGTIEIASEPAPPPAYRSRLKGFGDYSDARRGDWGR